MSYSEKLLKATLTYIENRFENNESFFFIKEKLLNSLFIEVDYLGDAVHRKWVYPSDEE